jgi:hypothetical protein
MVPALIGIDPVGNFLTEIHAHPRRITDADEFHSGPAVLQWGVKSTANCLGRYRGYIAWWVNGRKMTGDPTQLVLDAHQEIVIAAGQPPSLVPPAYSFLAGL